jgi:surface polysaccharide O-acyltransferase-like enzyme
MSITCVSQRDTGYLNILRVLACFAVIAFHVFHFICAFSLRFLTGFEAYLCTVLRNIWLWNVPMFFMISGVIFLDPRKQITTRKLLTKYVFRLVLALLVFGVPFTFMEIFFNSGYMFSFEQIGLSFLHTIQGKTWDHLWFLYGIIGVYLLLPLFKQFAVNTDKKLFEYILLVLFVFTGLIPAVENIFAFKFGFYIPICSVYVFYFLLGHYIHEYNVSINRKILSCFGILYLVCAALPPINSAYGQVLEAVCWGGGGVTVLITLTIFCYIRQNCKSGVVYGALSPLCFGIYLVHMLFLNFFYRVLKFTPENYPLLLAAPVMLAVVTLLSAAFSYFTRKIKIVRKYIL